MIHARPLVAAWILASACIAPAVHADDAWVARLDARVEAIDASTPGALGVVVKRLGDGTMLDHDGSRRWYLASTVKIPVALAVLRAAQDGALDLDESIELREADFVDGSGDLVWQKPGAHYTVRELLAKSIENSDSVATDMLIRRVGVDALNARLARWVPGGFGPITTILQVRYDAYAELHPRAKELSNLDIVKLRNAEAGEPRLRAFMAALGVDKSELRAPDIEAAFERYYAGDRNTATLDGFANLLGKLANGELLDRPHAAILLGHMRRITTGSKRMAAGLPPGTVFAQKTGTQLARACNVGIIGDDAHLREAVIVAACLEKFDALPEAEAALQTLGRAIGDSGVLR